MDSTGSSPEAPILLTDLLVPVPERPLQAVDHVVRLAQLRPDPVMRCRAKEGSRMSGHTRFGHAVEALTRPGPWTP